MHNMSYVVTIMWKLHVNIVGVGLRVGDWRGIYYSSLSFVRPLFRLRARRPCPARYYM
jgi:hypothetical protein